MSSIENNKKRKYSIGNDTFTTTSSGGGGSADAQCLVSPDSTDMLCATDAGLESDTTDTTHVIQVKGSGVEIAKILIEKDIFDLQVNNPGTYLSVFKNTNGQWYQRSRSIAGQTTIDIEPILMRIVSETFSGNSAQIDVNPTEIKLMTKIGSISSSLIVGERSILSNPLIFNEFKCVGNDAEQFVQEYMSDQFDLAPGGTLLKTIPLDPNFVYSFIDLTVSLSTYTNGGIVPTLPLAQAVYKFDPFTTSVNLAASNLSTLTTFSGYVNNQNNNSGFSILDPTTLEVRGDTAGNLLVTVTSLVNTKSINFHTRVIVYAKWVRYAGL